MVAQALALLFLLGVSLTTEAADPVVKVAEGSLRGQHVQGAAGTKPYVAFRGIPYGQPPVDELRFKAPRPAKAWSGERAAVAEGSVCTQPDFKGGIIGSDDCLYLNVYTPTVTCEKPLPVIVWLFGGAFFWGNGGAGWYGPDFINHNDVVLVSPNYRVGPNGYLNLGTAFAPGNAGLKDAKLALEWTKKNVRAFCGDPSQVTVAGFSAGAMMAHALALSPHSQGLFQRAFLLSGNALTPVAHRDDHLEKARELATLLGAKDNSTAGLQAVFAKATSQQIAAAYRQMLLDQALPFTQPKFAMSSENEAASEADLKGSTVLTTDPEALARSGAVKQPVPILASHTPAEGLFIFLVALTAPSIKNSEAALLERLRSRFDEVLTELALRVPEGAAKLVGVPAGVGTAAQRAEVAALLRKTYFGGRDTFTRDQFAALNGGAEFIGPTLNYLRICRGEVSLVETDVETSYNFFSKNYFKVPYHTTAIHGDDLGYLFHPNELDLKQDIGGKGVDAAVLRYVSTMVTDFAKGRSVGVKAACGSGNPQPYLHINGATPTAAQGFGSAHQVWNQVFERRRKQKS